MEKVAVQNLQAGISLRKIINQNAESIVSNLWNELKTVDLVTIEESDGRTNHSHESCKKGSFVYLLYSHNDELLYVGETGERIKTRLTGDGSGSHNRKDWYHEISYIKYLRDNNDKLNETERKILEETITLIKKPRYYR